MGRQRGVQLSAQPKPGAGGTLLTAVLAVAVGLAGLEAFARLIDGVGFSARSFVAERLALRGGGYPGVYDPRLGHIPAPGYDGTANVWKTRVTIDAASLRRNAPGQTTPVPAAVVAVGGSKTFGNGVSDAETWPAQLQGMLGQPVANGGVFGFGIDQSVLRAETLVPEYRPWAVVVSFAYGDVRRAQLIQSDGIEKPYFEIADGGLVLRNVPPSANRPRVGQMGLVRAALGYSYLADWTARRLDATGWWYGSGFPPVEANTDGPRVACMLMGRLKALAEVSGAVVLVVAQYGPRNLTAPDDPVSVEELKGTARVLECAKAAGLATLDTLPALRTRYQAGRSTFEGQYFLRMSMSVAGNRMVAEQVADALARTVNGD